MKVILLLANESISLVTALFLGFRAFLYMSNFQKLMFFQLLVWILFYLILYGVTLCQSLLDLEQNNLFVLNLSVACEFALLLYASGYYGEFNWLKKDLKLYILFTFIIVGGNIYLVGMGKFSLMAYIILSYVILVIYSILLWQNFNLNDTSKTKWPDMVVLVGIIIFFACTIPYLSFQKYLYNKYPKLNESLFHLIIDQLANIRYLCLAMGFWLIRKNVVQKHPN